MLHCPAKSHNQHAPHAHALLMTCLRLCDPRPARLRPSPQPKPTRAVLLAPHCTESISSTRRSHKRTRAAQPACAMAHTRSPHSVHTCATCVLRDLSPPRTTRPGKLRGATVAPVRIQRFHRPSAAQTHATRTASTHNTHTHFPCPLCACATCMPRDLSAPALARGPRSAISACTHRASPQHASHCVARRSHRLHIACDPGTMHCMPCDPSATARPTLDPQSERPPHARGPLTPAASAFPSTRPSHVRTRLRVACTVRLRPARHTHRQDVLLRTHAKACSPAPAAVRQVSWTCPGRVLPAWRRSRPTPSSPTPSPPLPVPR